MNQNLPPVTGHTPFERMNAVLSTFEFDSEIDDATRKRLEQAVLQFNKTIPGGELKPRFFLTFLQPNQMNIRQLSSTEAPTKVLFDRLVTELGIVLPEPEVAWVSAAEPVSQPVPEVATGRLRGPHGYFLPTPRQGTRA